MMHEPQRSELTAAEQACLLSIARASIEHGLARGCCAPSAADAQPAALRTPGASFVTLKLDCDLRGCIGSLEALRPLAEDVHENAYAAAFRDPRFAPLSAAEWPRVQLELSILSAPEAVAAVSEAALLAALRPGHDGLILEYGARRGTFLPAVWEMLPEPADFVRRLKLKMGLPADFWAETLRAYRYTSTHVGGAER